MTSADFGLDPERLLALGETRRISTSDYHRMIEAGILDEDERLELLEGVIVRMSPQNPLHALVVQRLSDPEVTGSPGNFVVRVQLPLTLGEESEPEPDIALVRRADAQSRVAHPRTALLVIEVAGGSLRRDRRLKTPLYARAGIGEYVIVDLENSTADVHRDPDSGSGRYASVTSLGVGERFESTHAPGYAFALADVFR